MFFCVQKALCDEVRDYAISISPVFGALWGQAEEIVYKYPNKGTHISQLLWDIKPLFYAGAEVEFGPRDPFARGGFTAGVSAQFGLPFRTGIMEDRDWLNYDYDIDTLNYYSRHEAFSSGSFWTELSAGYSWAFLSRINLGIYGEFSYLRFFWEGAGGYLQYAAENPSYSAHYDEWDPSLPKRDISGVIIDYAQNWFIFAPGVAASYRISQYVALELSVAWTPLIYGVCIDNHIQRKPKLHFEDYLIGGFSLKDRLTVVFSVNDKAAFYLSGGSRLTSGSRGDSYAIAGESNDGTYNLAPNSAGGGFLVLDVSLSAKIQL
jgi:outer membrane protease